MVKADLRPLSISMCVCLWFENMQPLCFDDVTGLIQVCISIFVQTEYACVYLCRHKIQKYVRKYILFPKLRFSVIKCPLQINVPLLEVPSVSIACPYLSHIIPPCSDNSGDIVKGIFCFLQSHRRLCTVTECKCFQRLVTAQINKWPASHYAVLTTISFILPNHTQCRCI